MNKRILGLILILVSTCTVQAEQIPLITDPQFERGFEVLDPTPGAIVVEGNLQWDTSAGPLIWQLAQWDSQSSIIGVAPTVLPSGARNYADVNKQIIAGGGSTAAESDLVLTVNGVNEYDGQFRGPADPWPTLLVSQRISDPGGHIGSQSPSIADMTSLDFQIDARLLYDHRTTTSGYDPSLHASQYVIFYTIQNLNIASAGYGDFLWFGTALYDDREEVTGKHVLMDDFSQKLIYSIGIEPFTSERIADGNWMTVGGDLLPHMKAALDTAWSNGILLDSQDYADYRIGGMNMGWEMTGLNDASMQIRNYSVVATANAQPNATLRGLWHMDTIDIYNDGSQDLPFVADDNNTVRDDHPLLLGTRPQLDIEIVPTLTPSAPGMGNALLFDGVDDYAVAYSVWDNPEDRISIDFLMRPDGLPDPQGDNFMGLVGVLPFQTYWQDDGSGNGTGRIFTLAFDDDLAPAATVISQAGLALDEWHEVHADVANGVVTLTVNGVTTTGNMAAPLADNTSAAVVGRMVVANMRYFQGALDEIRIATDPYSVTPGDFDQDGDVDGNDFLVWQQGGSPHGTTSGDLTDWRNHFGEGGGATAAASAVPEPTAALLALLGLGWLAAAWRQRRSSLYREAIIYS